MFLGAVCLSVCLLALFLVELSSMSQGRTYLNNIFFPTFVTVSKIGPLALALFCSLQVPFYFTNGTTLLPTGS